MLESQGKTVEEAIENGLREMILARETVDVTVLDEGAKGFLGIGAKPARVLLTEKLKSQIEAQQKQAQEAEKRAAREAKEARDREILAAKEAQEREKREEQQRKQAEINAAKAKQAAIQEAKPQPRPKVEPAKPTAQEAPKPAAPVQPAKPIVLKPAQLESAEPKREEAPRRQPLPPRPPRPAQPQASQPPRQRPPRSTDAKPLSPEEAQALSVAAKEYFAQIVKHMGVDVTIAASIEENGLRLEASGPDAGTLIGYRGETLDALQYLVSLKTNRGEDGYQRVTLDSENYRIKREETLVKLAHRLATKAVKTGRKVTLEPMNPYERRILHSALQNNNNVRTHSEGEEPYRKVVITPRRDQARSGAASE